MVELAEAEDFIEFEVSCPLYQPVFQLLSVLVELWEPNMPVILPALPMAVMEEFRHSTIRHAELRAVSVVDEFNRIRSQLPHRRMAARVD
jgi:hypothetical protein